MKIDTSFLQANLAKQPTGIEKLVSKSSDAGFERFLEAASSLFEETNQQQLEYEKMQVDYVTGKTDDLIALSMAGSRASTSLQFTTQITSRIAAAYQEIMRIQI